MVCRGPSADWLCAAAVDGLLGLAAVAGLWAWWCLAAAEYGWANLEEAARVGGEVWLVGRLGSDGGGGGSVVPTAREAAEDDERRGDVAGEFRLAVG